MKLILWIYSLISTNSIIIESSEKPALRIFNGIAHEKTQIQYPFIVILVEKYKRVLVRLCTGTLISPNYVLTAAHCFTPRLTFIQYGDMHLSPMQSQKKTAVIDTIKHPNYLRSKINLFLHDIGLAHVSNIVLPNYGHMIRENYICIIGHPVIMLGFGQHIRENMTIEQKNTQPLLIGDGTLVDCNSEIDKQIRKGKRRYYYCVSANSTKFNHIMSGDAGGPLLYNGFIIGVASQAYLRRAVSVYSAINRQVKWIKTVAFKKTSN